MSAEIDGLMSEAAAHERAGRLADAEATLRRVLTIAPDHPEAVGELGLVAYHRGDLQQAVTLLRRAAELAPDDWRVHLNLGLLLRRLERNEEAVEPLRRVPMMEPLRGTKAHVGALFDSCRTPAELLDRLSS